MDVLMSAGISDGDDAAPRGDDAGKRVFGNGALAKPKTVNFLDPRAYARDAGQPQRLHGSRPVGSGVT
jgi:hypothetical protein